MPGRKYPLVSGEIYHLFNRGIDRRPTFTTKRECLRAIQTINFYRFLKQPMSLSKYLRLDDKKQIQAQEFLFKSQKLIEILSFCLMPNHFHFLVKQVQGNGISKFLSNFQNSYTKYFNTRHERNGSLFLNQFKAVRIETDDQLIHVSRYIHLNPHTGFVVKNLEELENYNWSSFPDYLKERSDIADVEFILAFFKNSAMYKSFVFDQADYQRSLKEVEHLTLE